MISPHRDQPSVNSLAALARLAMEPSGVSIEHVTRACRIVQDALGAEDVYIVRTGDPHFVRLGSDADPTTYEIKQRGYYLIWRELATYPRVAGAGVQVADRLVQDLTPLLVGERPTHIASLLPGHESQSEMLIARGPWSSPVSAEMTTFMLVARPLLAAIVSSYLDAERRRQQRRQLELLADVAGASSQAEQMDGVLTNMATALAQASGYDWVTIALVDPAVEQVIDSARNVSRYSDTTIADSFWSMEFRDNAWLAEARRLKQTGRPLLRPDVFARRERPPRAGATERHALALRRHYEEAHILSTADLPISFQEQFLGVVFFASCTRRAFGPEEVSFLTALVSQAAAGIGGLRLQRELRERRRQLEELIGRFLSAHEEERRRVAYEIHDGAAQTIAAAHQHMQAFAARYRPRRPQARAELTRAAELVQQAVRDTRRVVAGLRPTVLDDFGLAAALRMEVAELQANGWEVTYEETLGAERLPARTEAALFRIAQEAITNARKHSGDTRLAVTLGRSDGYLRLEVRDWGRGFEPDAVGKQRGPGEQVGLAGMRERGMLLGGNVRVESRPDEGTRVIVEVQT